MNDEKPKESLKILNSREKKEINERIFEIWGCDLDKSLVFLLSNKEKLYVARPEIGYIDFKKLKIDKVGLYVCTVTEKDLRLSIEGSQIIGKNATKNIVDIDDSEMFLWMRGNDITKQISKQGYVIIRHCNDFVGCGKATPKGIMNFVPKARRINSKD